MTFPNLDPFYDGEGDLSIEQIQTLRGYVWRGSPVILSPKAAARVFRAVERDLLAQAQYDSVERQYDAMLSALKVNREQAERIVELERRLNTAERELDGLRDKAAKVLAALSTRDVEATEAQMEAARLKLRLAAVRPVAQESIRYYRARVEPYTLALLKQREEALTAAAMLFGGQADMKDWS